MLNNGPKWSVLAKRIVDDRNKHAVKNRFFSLLSAYTLIPIRKIKKEIAYLNKALIFEALEFHKASNEVCSQISIPIIEEKVDFNQFETQNGLAAQFSLKSYEDVFQFLSTCDDFIPLY